MIRGRSKLAPFIFSNRKRYRRSATLTLFYQEIGPAIANKMPHHKAARGSARSYKPSWHRVS
jgi:hypothetical protein